MVKKQLVEVARSFSYKLNLGNYQTADFFCSQKAEVDVDDADMISGVLHDFCREQVVKAVNEYKKSLPKKVAQYKVKAAEQDEQVDSLQREELEEENKS